MAALYLFVVSLFATALGPTSMRCSPIIYSKVLPKLGYSMSVVAAIVGPIGCAVFLMGLRPFAKAIAEQAPAN